MQQFALVGHSVMRVSGNGFPPHRSMVSPPALPSKIVDHKGNRAIIGHSQIAEPSSIDPDSSFLMFLKCSRGFFYSCSRNTLMNGGTGFMPRKALM